jgi:hypothetical protein
VVVKGEDPGEFELYRQQMLEELAPVGALEEMLAQRIVGLSWRLRRAERLQTLTYDEIEVKSEQPEPTMSPEDASWLLRMSPGQLALSLSKGRTTISTGRMPVLLMGGPALSLPKETPMLLSRKAALRTGTGTNRAERTQCATGKLGKEDVHGHVMSGNRVDAQRVQLPRGKGSPPAASESCMRSGREAGHEA